MRRRPTRHPIRLSVGSLRRGSTRPFPTSAAWGDIITAVLAVPMLVLARDPARHVLALQAWNLFGMLDLAAALTLGVTSAAGSPLH